MEEPIVFATEMASKYDLTSQISQDENGYNRTKEEHEAI